MRAARYAARALSREGAGEYNAGLQAAGIVKGGESTRRSERCVMNKSA
jgi:hypothetical protein